MIECKFRIPVNPQNNKGIEKAMDTALNRSGRSMVPSIVVGQLRQSFENGLCALLTQNDIGPMACLQPEHSEATCPDIEDLRG